ncbi:MAG: hypothetical protein K0S65_213 [Labilithrix sp.]|nr:hypothetical protein [Labilithrix sp.]
MSRPAFLYLAVSLTCTAALATGCSGAEQQDVLLGASGSSSSGSSGDDNASSSSGDPSGSSGTSGPASSSGDSECQAESEPNDSKDEANTLEGCAIGTLSTEDRKDFLTFRLSPQTKAMSLNFKGQVRLRVTVEGQGTTELTPQTKASVPFVLDQDYMVEIAPFTDSKADVTWRVEVVEK